MSSQADKEVLTANLCEHSAVKAWAQLEPERAAPEALQVLKLCLKSAVYRLDGVGADGSAVIAKKCLTETAEVEWTIYKELLPQLPLRALHCYGIVHEPGDGYSWLFLEAADGSEYSPLADEDRAVAAKWIGDFHGAAMKLGAARWLPLRNTAYYLDRLRSARSVIHELRANPVVPEHDRAVIRSVTTQCDVLETHWAELEEDCSDAPQTVVHGDFVIKNCRIRPVGAGHEFLLYDWEVAGWGVPATDLAQATGRVVSPDLDTYASVLARHGVSLDAAALRRLAACGNFFRLVDVIAWACTWVVNDDYRFLQKPISFLRSYEARLSAALRAAGWTNGVPGKEGHS